MMKARRWAALAMGCAHGYTANQVERAFPGMGWIAFCAGFVFVAAVFYLAAVVDSQFEER